MSAARSASAIRSRARVSACSRSSLPPVRRRRRWGHPPGAASAAFDRPVETAAPRTPPPRRHRKPAVAASARRSPGQTASHARLALGRAVAENVGSLSLRTDAGRSDDRSHEEPAGQRRCDPRLPGGAEPRRHGPLEVFTGATSADRDRRPRRRGYEVRILSRDGAPLAHLERPDDHSSCIAAPAPARIDTLIVPGGRGQARPVRTALLDWIARASAGPGARPRSARAPSCSPAPGCSTAPRHHALGPAAELARASSACRGGPRPDLHPRRRRSGPRLA